MMRSYLGSLTAAVVLVAGCASAPPPRFDDGVPNALPAAGAPFAASAAQVPSRLAYDGFDSGPLLEAPAFTRASDGEYEQRLTAERLAQEQRLAPRRETREPPVTEPLGRTPPDSPSPYWLRPWSGGRNASPALGDTQTGQPDPAHRIANLRNPAADPGRNTGLTVPETLAVDPDSTGTGGAAIPPMPEANPGECFALVRRPALYPTAQRDYVLRPPADRLQIEPARVVAETQMVTTQEAYETLEVVPASFRLVTEQIEVSPATTRYVTSEPVYQTVTERIEERPARSVWRPGHGKVEKTDQATGQVMSLVEEPAVYRTVTRQVLKEPAQMREVTIPAQTRSMTRRVIDRPEQVRRVRVPAQQSRVPVTRVVQNAEVTRVPVPGRKASYTVETPVSEAALEWRPVLCEASVTPDLIRRVQIQLTAVGLEPGPASGQLNSSTVAALNAYQRQRGLPEDRYLNVETARALGVWR